MERIAFVGNAATNDDVSATIDRADWVVRFNGANGFQSVTGSRVDDLFLINCGGQMHEWLHSTAFWLSPQIRTARYISLPVEQLDRRPGLERYRMSPASERDGINYELEARRRLSLLHKHTRTLPDPIRRQAIQALGYEADTPAYWPSTGFLALYWYDLTQPKDTLLDLYGFSFGGWSGHAWSRERAWIIKKMITGRVRWNGLDHCDDSAATPTGVMQ